MVNNYLVPVIFSEKNTLVTSTSILLNFDINFNNNLLDDTANESPSLKNGIKYPTSTNCWDIANVYFHSNLPTSKICEKDTEEPVKS